jgi:four helix bundle protein
VQSFYDLEAWKAARELRNSVAELTKIFPKDEQYRLKDQIIRSTRSSTANIAEGFGRFHHKENIQFCRQARGSLFETLDHLICAYDEKIITEEVLKEYKEKVEKCLKILNGYIAYLKKAVDIVKHSC